MPVGKFCANKVLNSSLGFKFWARGIVLQDLNRRISFCTSHFSSDSTKCKADGRCYDFKLEFKTQVIYTDKMLSSNALSVFILHHYLNGLGDINLCSIQDIMRASEPAKKKYKKVCEDFPNLAILTKSATTSKVQFNFGHATVRNKYLEESVVSLP